MIYFVLINTLMDYKSKNTERRQREILYYSRMISVS